MTMQDPLSASLMVIDLFLLSCSIAWRISSGMLEANEEGCTVSNFSFMVVSLSCMTAGKWLLVEPVNFL